MIFLALSRDREVILSRCSRFDEWFVIFGELFRVQFDLLREEIASWHISAWLMNS